MGMFPYLHKGESPRKDMSGQKPDITSEPKKVNRFCAVCNSYGNVFTLHEIHIPKHIQGVGEVIAPAVINHKRVKIQVCDECSMKMDNMIPNAIEEYHLGA